MSPEVKEAIERAIRENKVILFMKGTRQAPSCGFSAKTVEMLDAELGNYETVDVLSHPEIRDGIKEYSAWPTLPQLYVRGEFLGGADIIEQMFEEGTLGQKLGAQKERQSAPKISLTERAASALLGFIGDSGEVVILDVDRDFRTGLSIGPRPPSLSHLEVSGVPLYFDRLTGGRVDGLRIDYVETHEGSAFKIDNPNEPPKMRSLSVSALKARLDRGDALRLIDVRSPGEWDTARIEGAELLDSSLFEALMDLPKESVLVFQCHHGHRSARVAEQFVQAGFREVFNLSGGIEAWSLEIDPEVPRY